MLVAIYTESTYLVEPLKNSRSYCLNGQMNYMKYKDNTEKGFQMMGNLFESLFSINPDQNLITPSSFFLALLVARAFNTVFCRSIRIFIWSINEANLASPLSKTIALTVSISLR